MIDWLIGLCAKTGYCYGKGYKIRMYITNSLFPVIHTVACRFTPSPCFMSSPLNTGYRMGSRLSTSCTRRVSSKDVVKLASCWGQPPNIDQRGASAASGWPAVMGLSGMGTGWTEQKSRSSNYITGTSQCTLSNF